MTVAESVDQILAVYRENGGNLPDEDWQAVARLITEMVRSFPNLPKALFVPMARLFVPVAVELVIVRDGRVLLKKREFCGDVGYHTPGTYLAPGTPEAPGETWLQAAQRCADYELQVKVISAEPFGPAINHTVHPRFHDLSVLVRCEIEGEPAVGEWFGKDDHPPMLAVQRRYWRYITEAMNWGGKS